MVRDFTVPGFVNFVKSVQGILYDAGYVLILAGSEDKIERESEILNAFSERRADGLTVIVTGAGPAAAATTAPNTKPAGRSDETPTAPQPGPARKAANTPTIHPNAGRHPANSQATPRCAFVNFATAASSPE